MLGVYWVIRYYLRTLVQGIHAMFFSVELYYPNRDLNSRTINVSKI